MFPINKAICCGSFMDQLPPVSMNISSFSPISQPHRNLQDEIDSQKGTDVIIGISLPMPKSATIEKTASLFPTSLPSSKCVTMVEKW